MEKEKAIAGGVAPASVSEPSEAELTKLMNEAIASGDFKQVAKVASELVKFQKAKEQSELDIKLKSLQELNVKVSTAVMKALKPMYDSGELDKADGVWSGWDFTATIEKGINPYCRLVKTAAKKSGGGGGGGGKRFNVSSVDMLAKYGGQPYKESGMTIQQAWDADTDKNKRFAVRETLLKLDGQIS